MRVPWERLTELVPVADPPEAVAERLSRCALEVDAVERPLPGVVVARVAEARPHPNADRLTLCAVETADGERRPVVCGAPNVRAGQKVALALPGTVLPNGATIKKSRIRGEESSGMLCAADELGLGADHAGILVLDDDAPLGAPAAGPLGLGSAVLEVDLLPDRGDCASLFGVAREVAALYGLPAHPPDCAVAETGPAAEGDLAVEVRDPERCPRYMARLVRGVRVAPSPAWLARRLLSVGARPINNVVDVTNWILHELGQPLHAFDAATLAGGRIVVRCAEPGERIRLLDDSEPALDADDLVIADAGRPIALAGVMGGADTAVGEGTADVVLEAACFAPDAVRRSARRHGLRTDSSYRFERGVDPAGVARALDRAARLLVEVAGGAVAAGALDLWSGERERAPVRLRPERVLQLLGLPLPTSEVTARLERLGIRVQREDGLLHCLPPSWRWDLRQEADLLEEVVRLGGYDALPETLPDGAHAPAAAPAVRRIQEGVRDALRAEGYSECVSLAFLSRADLDRLRLGPEDARRTGAVALDNPIGEELALLRTSLLPGLLRGAARNRRHGVDGLRHFELGRTFTARTSHRLPRERRMAAGVAVPAEAPAFWRREAEAWFFEAKHAVLAACRAAGHPARVEAGETSPSLHPEAAGRIVVGDGEGVGEMGRIHPDAAAIWELPAEAVLFELDLDVLEAVRAPAPAYRPAPKFPSVQRDLAFLLPEPVSAGRAEDEIRRAAGPRLEGVVLFDRYTGEGVPAGRKSMAWRLTLRAADRTLQEKEVTRILDKVVSALERSLGAERR